MSDNEPDPEDLLSEAKNQTRHTTEPTQSAAPGAVDRTTAIKDAWLEIEDGEAPQNINIRDTNLKALFVGLQEAGDLEDVAGDIASALESDVAADGTTQSDLARLLIRAGLQEVVPGVLEDATDARQQAVLEQANDF
jgi:hypothetical protein